MLWTICFWPFTQRLLVSFSNNVRTCTIFLHLGTIIRRAQQLIITVSPTLKEKERFAKLHFNLFS